MDIEQMDDGQIEEAARAQGWKPEEEWKGEPPSRGFVSAKEFLEVGSKSLPLATKQLHELESELESVKGELQKVKQTSARYVDMTNKKMAKDREHIQSLISEQQKARAKAISDADGEAVVAAEAKIAEYRQEEAALTQPDPSIQEWASDNDWYEKDPVLKDLADGMSNRLRNERPDLEGRAHLDELSRRVKEAMPDKFENPKRKQAPPVGGAQRSAPSGGKTFEDLPADAKAAFNDFKDMMKGIGKEYTKDDYLANYEWETE